MSRPFRLTAPRASENDIEDGCMTILALHHYKVYRLHVGIFQSLDCQRKLHGAPKGTPDYACMHGQFRNFLLEVKRPGGVLSPHQEKEIAALEQVYGLRTAVVASVEELCTFLAWHERSP